MVDVVNTPDEGNAQAVTEPENTVPQEYQGKSPEQLVEMHQQLMQKLGQQSEELGSLRKLADQVLLSEPASSTEVSSDADVDFFSDPERAIERIIERKLRPYDELTRKQAEQATVQQLDAEFPGWKDTAQSEEFQEWVARSKVRTELFLRADKADYTAASELFDTWGELGKNKASTVSSEKKAVDRDRKLRAATTEKGSAGIDPRKILSRSDLRALRQNNPNRYNELLPDIRKAYAEGRVR